LFDQGLTMDQVAQLALDARLGTRPRSAEVVAVLWKNVMGTEVDPRNLADLSGLIDSRMLSAAQLTTKAAELEITGQLIDLAGLARTGWEFSS